MERLYLLGHPIAHSKSPAMHNAAYRALGLDWTYGLADFETEWDAWDFLVGREWRAINITTPWKRLALQATGNLSAAACLALGANVLVNDGESLFGDNTDGRGCVAYLARCGFDFCGKSVAVCGTGPTSLAIMHACAQAGASRIALLGRDGDRCRSALDSYHERIQLAHGLKGGSASSAEEIALFEPMAYGEATDLLESANLIIDATPLGMNADDPAPFDTSLLSSGQVVLDVVYGHGVTQLLSDARAAGCEVHDGRGMLVAQAVETVRVISEQASLFQLPERVDLFQMMADAAGFDL